MRPLFLIIICLFSFSLSKSQTATQYIDNAIKKMKNNNFVGAITDLDNAISKNSRSDYAYALRAYCKGELGDSRGSVNDLTKAIAINPNEAEFYYNRGIHYMILKNLHSALADFTKAISLESKHTTSAYLNRGTIYHDLSMYNKAIADYNKIISIGKGNIAAAYFNRGNAKSMLEDFSGAMKDYDKAIELDDKYVGAYYRRCVLKIKYTNDFKGAIQDITKVISFDPFLASAYRLRGVAKRAINDYRGAIDDFGKAIELEPNSPYAYDGRAEAKYKLHLIEEACLDWSRAGELGLDAAYKEIEKYCNSPNDYYDFYHDSYFDFYEYDDEISTTTEQEQIISNSFTDTRDGNIYKTVQIGKQVWMAENLKYLPSVVGPSTGSETTPYYYVYGYDGTNVTDAKATSNYNTYGVLYNWPAAMAGSASSNANPSGVQGVCPAGWHLPSDAEWTELTDYLGGTRVAGGKLKETGTTHWNSPNTGATNETGFTALPGGSRYNNGNFTNIRYHGGWWSSTEYGTYLAWYRYAGYNFSDVGRLNYGKEVGFSVRCVRD